MKSCVTPSIADILEVNGVGEGTRVNVGWTVGGTTVGVAVFASRVTVDITLVVGMGVTCDPHAASRKKKGM